MKLSELKTLHKSNFKDYDQLKNDLTNNCSEILKIYRSTNGSNLKIKKWITDYKDKLPDQDWKFAAKHLIPANIIWRGEHTDVKYFVNDIFTHREPKYLNKLTHDVSIKAFKNLDLPANRENSIFCGTRDIAGDWGTPYVIFPFNGFRSVWFKSSKIKNTIGGCLYFGFGILQ